MIVVDTNILMHLFVEGTQTEVVEEIYSRESDWVAPSLWRHEYRNAVVVLHREERLEESQARSVLRAAEDFMESRSLAVPTDEVFEVARGSTLSAYDCEFVALARLLERPLLTKDQSIRRAFPGITVNCEEYLEG